MKDMRFSHIICAMLLAAGLVFSSACGKDPETAPPAGTPAPVKTAVPQSVRPKPANVQLIFCPTCNRNTGKGHVCKETSLCTICYNEVGSGHICGVTHYCRECKKEIGKNHQMRPAPEHCLTYFCEKCGFDKGPGHICGVTHFCPKCEEEAGVNHKCGLTSFCAKCKNDVLIGSFCTNCYTVLGPPELADTKVLCPVCKTEVIAAKHNCKIRQTFFCPICEKEQPAGHRH